MEQYKVSFIRLADVHHSRGRLKAPTPSHCIDDLHMDFGLSTAASGAETGRVLAGR